jgi:FKBP-type peptidyl-prolyl cis-trans isomerase FkpA
MMVTVPNRPPLRNVRHYLSPYLIDHRLKFMSPVLDFARRLRATAVTAITVAAIVSAAGCTSSEPADRPSNPATDSYASSLGINTSQFTKLSDDILYRDLAVGTGAEATAGKTIRVTYTGWLPNGSEFESNEGDPPYQFALGAGLVVQGWDQGIVGMRVGGKRRLLIGSAAGYGRTGRGDIPPNTTMIFDVTLISAQ